MSFILRVLSKAQSVLDFIFGLRFLPDKFQDWLFGTGTRIIEVLSGFAMLGFALVFALHGEEMIKEDLYEKFLHLHPKIFVTILVIVAVGQLFAAFFQSSRSNILSGCFLIWSALIWVVISGAFIAAYPPLSTGMTTYPVIAIICALAGRNLIKHTKRVEDKKGGE
jgi:cytochrome bd-type quinol oxidase subunit 2